MGAIFVTMPQGASRAILRALGKAVTNLRIPPMGGIPQSIFVTEG